MTAVGDYPSALKELSKRLSENAHLSCETRDYPHPSSLRSTSMEASFLWISEALHPGILSQPLQSKVIGQMELESSCDEWVITLGPD
jgi:hypothetical protein